MEVPIAVVASKRTRLNFAGDNIEAERSLAMRQISEESPRTTWTGGIHEGDSTKSNGSRIVSNFDTAVSGMRAVSTDPNGRDSTWSRRFIARQRHLLQAGKTKALANAFASISGATFLWPDKPDHPWLDEECRRVWPKWRVMLAQIVLSKTFDSVMLVIILSNLVLIIYETDQEAKCYPSYKDQMSDCKSAMKNIPWLYATNMGLLIIYSLEVVTLLLVRRLAFIFCMSEEDDADTSRYCWRLQRMNVLDILICVVGWMSEAFDFGVNVSWLRIIRVCRLFRHPYIKKFNELHGMVSGFAASMKAIAFGAALIFGALVFSSILVVQYIHPLNLEIDHGTCERCPRGFETVATSSLTLFQQIIAGDSWGQISIPNIERDWKAAMLLPLVNFVIGLGVTNLILAVIVDRAIDARETSREDAFKEKLKKQKQRKTNLVNLFQTLDVDHNGVLDFEELSDAYRYSNEFKLMMLEAGIHWKDLREVFDYLDDNSNGEIEYIELCNALDDTTQREANIAATLAKMKIDTTQRVLGKKLDDMNRRLHKVDGKLDRLLGDKGGSVVDLTPEKKFSDTASDASLGATSDHNSLVALRKNKKARDETLEPIPKQNSFVTVAKQSNVTTATATVTLAQQDNMIDLLHSLQDLKMDIDRQFRQQVARSTKFEAELSSALTSLGKGSSQLGMVPPPTTPPYANHCRMTVSSPRLLTPRTSPPRSPPISGQRQAGARSMQRVGQDFPVDGFDS